MVSVTLVDRISQRIGNHPQNRITFAEYMEMALYDPKQGYYNHNSPQIGAQGDFFTSPHLGSDFGELLAEQLVEMWEILGKPEPFTLVEMGAGQGILAADIIGYLQGQYPQVVGVLDYAIAEKSTRLKTEQQRRFQQLGAPFTQIRWCDLDEIANHSITGCFFSNELIDAFPVHLVTRQNNQLQEIYLTTTGSKSDYQLAEVVGELSTPQLADYFRLVGIDLLSEAYPEGYRTEVNLAALGWIETVARKLRRGFVLTIDYGYSADRLYSPTRREGTLQCYYQHRHHNNPYIYIGEQDITAHVDFTALQQKGRSLGLQTIGFTQQALFMMALGLGDRIATVSEGPKISQVLRRREALHSLIDPMGLGNFGVLIQGTFSEDVKLRGLSSPQW
ncbi:MAG: class I SAM-dependent methyltransferase [Limnospira sp. PMC 1291.21]|uniref:class I SAM-dependent methyltransferase n=1 Tax=unclassified Limnospira TaxID=2642885 RepID=UPI0028E13947|nr:MULTISPECIES: class I SAM-dependent methyltransferase [unclassified Limnospira]MDT9176984.1 class I SAM-dependent methyltransferase [Limnospira sp. PMC 1238.20]MDT9192609.1 class I SAM-dependent methyltransferase [Limnospira sp. PMC 1245.20]MDT9202936.1 class I SAM-dependent methyltransferase [Limnospira sp. PMC 1243.20]MDT9207689.1 class I SAM-dependent methyltransferase [Limnospira sp. PMC 1252.20]MDT9212852.1 class I SAM-dependent methyltransferase [Limnospira sp. PMC 1256.20]